MGSPGNDDIGPPTPFPYPKPPFPPWRHALLRERLFPQRGADTLASTLFELLPDSLLEDKTATCLDAARSGGALQAAERDTSACSLEPPRGQETSRRAGTSQPWQGTISSRGTRSSCRMRVPSTHCSGSHGPAVLSGPLATCGAQRFVPARPLASSHPSAKKRNYASTVWRGAY